MTEFTASKAVTSPKGQVSMDKATSEYDDRTYTFTVGTSGLLGTAIVRVINDERKITQVIFRKALIFKGQKKNGEAEVSWKQAGKVWKAQIQSNYRTLTEEIEHITQAKFVVEIKR